MKTFVRIVDSGSLTAAANSLDTSLPTVVRTLASLERDLGVSLLKRTTRRFHLTDEGTQYLERCRDILAATQEAEDILVARRTDPVGRLSVTASVAFGRRYLAPILHDFLRRHPKVSADVLFVDRVVNLIEEGMDVAVRIANLRDSSLVAIPVGKCDVSYVQASNTCAVMASRKCRTMSADIAASDMSFSPHAMSGNFGSAIGK
jgi:DNA-binding transcriptional LysR family regulator